MEEDEKADLILRLGKIYTPSTPIQITDFFSGRRSELFSAYQVIVQQGMHLIVFGDRGVGKTSFANILKARFDHQIQHLAKVICASTDSFDSLWRQIFSNLFVMHSEASSPIGFSSQSTVSEITVSLLKLIPEGPVSIPTIVQYLKPLDHVIIIIDEFDRLDSHNFNKKLFTDAVKAIADNVPLTTVIMIGIADDVNSLVEGHLSLERNLRQIYMPVMEPEEIKEIVVRGQTELNIKFTPETVNMIIDLSGGYPHFAHSLCYHAAYLCILEESEYVLDGHLKIAVKRTIDFAHESLRSAYQNATASQSDLFIAVLKAASVVRTNGGYFQARDLEPLMCDILDRKVRASNFSSHITRLCKPDRGEIFKITKTRNGHKYRFRNPLMRAYINLECHV